jgi:hypothetical protein
MALEDVEVDLDDDTLTIIRTPGPVESGNIVSVAIGGVGVGDEAGSGDGARVRGGGGLGLGMKV